MRAVLPDIGPQNVEITYATNGLGYVGRPAPVPVDVTLRLVGYEYTPLSSAACLARGCRCARPRPCPAKGCSPGEGSATDPIREAARPGRAGLRPVFLRRLPPGAPRLVGLVIDGGRLMNLDAQSAAFSDAAALAAAARLDRRRGRSPQPVPPHSP